ncbi:MAG: hypothetical protein QM682_17090 [Paracoccus sp. (in: a-proteobacteria)]|uniref:phage head-tail joining protein n=1 Tax=Paracoccus sp. TaxID=267 RepID=UPI0039E666DF
MPVVVEELAQMRDALIRARARGVRTLQVGTERVEYRTDAEMAAAINDLEARIARATTPARAGMVRFSTRKGF